jgi:ATP-dependent Zn protease
MGRAKEALIPIELRSSIDYKKIMDKMINIFDLFISIGMTYMIFSSLKGGGGRRNQDIMGVSKSNAKIFGLDSKIKVLTMKTKLKKKEFAFHFLTN